MIHTLDAAKIIETAQKLHRRMLKRFPDRGITALAQELCQAAEETAAVVERLKRPMMRYRVCSVVFILLILGSLIGVFVAVNLHPQAGAFIPTKLDENFGFDELLQTVESGVNDLIFLAIAVFFLIRLESRIKRDRALNMLHKLRSLAHIVDMHQLTKDPDSFEHEDDYPAPKGALRGRELISYYDYCSDMLSIISKLAALMVQDFDDPVTLGAVNEVETLTNGLSRKIWQKIVVTSQEAPPFVPRPPAHPVDEPKPSANGNPAHSRYPVKKRRRK